MFDRAPGMSALVLADILEGIARQVRHAAKDGESAEDRLAEIAAQLADGLQPRRLTTMPTNDESDTLLTAQGLADRLGCDVRSLRRWRRHVPKPVLIGGVQRWRRADVDRWLEARR